MGELGDKAKEEFLSEAQELIEGLSRDLLALDAAARKNEQDPELVNDVFRAVHTLKGLSGLFGAAAMGALSHDLEEVLDDLRLGRITLSREVLDVIFKAVAVYEQILAAERAGDREPTRAVEDFLQVLSAFRRKALPEGEVAHDGEFDLDPGLLAVLTEYEEHRLRANIKSGLSLYRIKARFSLMTLDDELERLKGAVKPHGEIITYLPTGDGGEIDAIELDVLIASRVPLDALSAALSSPSLRVEAVPRRAPRRTPLPSSFPPALRAPVADGPPSPLRAPSGAQLESSRVRPPSEIAELRPGKDLAAATNQSLRSVSQTVRVDIRKLDHLMNIVGELTIVRSALSRITERVRSNPQLRELGAELHRLQRGFERHLGEMQDGILEVRMVPIGQIFDKLGRVARQASREANKQVNLVITGAETEVDKLIVEELSDPLMHMVRNAIDHGIEPREQRFSVGKPETGTIAINAFQKGSHVVLEIEDDGRGMDPKKLAQTGVARGFIGEDEARELSAHDAFGLIFLPGFTTKDSPDLLAGRGVGMDIVKTNIARLGGVIDVQSELGIGTKMTITLPITLAILSALMVQLGEHTFAIPLSSVQEALVFDMSAVRVIDGREVMNLRGATLPLVHLERLFGVSGRGEGRRFVVVLSAGPRRLGVVVDYLEGQQDIVIQPLGKSLSAVRGFAGAAQLGDQRVGLVIDAPALLEEVLMGDVGKGALGARRDVA